MRIGWFLEWGMAFKNLFVPIFCKQCGTRLLTEENGFFCPTCWEMSPRVMRPYCTICGRPHPAAIGYETRPNYPCASCRERKAAPFHRIYGAAVYADAVETAIKLLKFEGKRKLVDALGDLMIGFAQEEMDCARYDFLVPVPLHAVRERDRGFNQSRLLAHRIVAAFPNARVDESLRRIRPTRVQSRLTNPAERRRNVVGAFEVQENPLLQDATVLLIDDVVTTGGTISECAAALRNAKVRRVDILATALACSQDVLLG